MKLITPVDGCYICLEVIKHKNRFMTMWRDDGHDYTKSAAGETWYRILGYADTHSDALQIIYPNPGDHEHVLRGYLVDVVLKMHGLIPISEE